MIINNQLITCVCPDLCPTYQAKQMSKKKSYDLLELIAAKRSLVEKKLENYIVNENGCWIWGGGIRSGYGYAVVYWLYEKYKISAHRLAYAFHHGVDPGKQLVCHSCDTPLCINPKHLRMGSWSDNMQDMHDKGRHRLSQHRQYTP